MDLDKLISERKRIWALTENLEADRIFREKAANDILLNAPLFKDLCDNPEKLIPLMFLIVDKKRRTIPFFPNTVQDHVLERIKQGRIDFYTGKRNSMKYRCLKGRQQGVTAIITALQLALTILTPNFTGFTMADTGDNAKTILNDKGKYPYRNIPEILKPHEKFNSQNEIFFDNLNSSWRIASAESGEAGRSRTISFFHGSECGFWSDYLGIMAALNPAITNEAIIFEETTANGHNDFYENWFDEESDYENIFLAWWLSDEYRLNFENEDIEKEFKDNIENEKTKFYRKLKVLRDDKGLDYNQLYWYFTKRKTLKDKLEQEYPCSEEEAFLFSGRPYFDRDTVERNILELSNIEPIESIMDGSFVIYEKPVDDEKYYIGADVAEGLADGDSSHAKIIKASTAEEVAYIHGKFSTDRFGNILVDYAKKYNNAYLGIENNNHGHAVINTVYINRAYRNIHFQYDVNKAAEKKNRAKKLGWTTSEATKYIMLDELDSALRDESVYFKDIELFKEAHRVLVDDKGRASINGKDRVAAAAIAWQMRKYYNKQNNVAEYYKKLADINRKKQEAGMRVVK